MGERRTKTAGARAAPWPSDIPEHLKTYKSEGTGIPTSEELARDKIPWARDPRNPNSSKRTHKPSNLRAAAAQNYARQLRWDVFPVPPGQKKSYKSAEYSGGRKWGRTKDLEEIRRDWQTWPEANVGIPTGVENGIFVVEIDTEEGHGVDGVAGLKQLQTERGVLPDTLMAESPSGSIHRYFKHPGVDVKIKNSVSEIAPGVDVRGDGGMVVAPPSVKGDHSYHWINEGTLIADAPEWLIELTKKPPRSSGAATASGGGNIDVDASELAAAMAAIPNDQSVEWTGWNRIGMALWRATDGSSEGLDLFDAWSQRWPGGYDAAYTAAKWDGYDKCPPTEIGTGTIFYLAGQANPYWRDAVGREKPATAEDQKAEDKESKTHAEPTTTPVDLWNKFEPPPLPKRLLPDVIEQFSIEQGTLMGADPAGLAGAAIAVCSAAIPDFIKLRVKQYSGWMESTRAWVGLVGDPSSKKSPITNRAAKPLTRIDTAMWRAYLADKTRWDALNKDEKKTSTPPRQTRLRLDDTTVEAAQEVMRDSPNGVLCFRDELSGWFGGMDKYAGSRGAAMDRGFWLQAYDGNPYAYNRVSRGSGMIENLSISVLGGIQPEPMRKLIEGSVDDGLIQRIIPIMVRRGSVGSDEPESPAAERYDDLVARLHNMKQPFDDVTFDDDAREIRSEMERKHNDYITCEAFNKKLASHIGKYDGIFARLCLLWHCIESKGEEPEPRITAATARRVADFLHTFLLPHALAFYTDVIGVSEDHDHLAAIAGYILAHKVEVLTNRIIQRGDRTMRGLDQRESQKICQQLDALGWLNRVPGPRPTDLPHWNVNPEVHRLFAARAHREEERRRREREMIVGLLGTKKSSGDNGDTA